ncbi:MAG TPA: MATE family efflux transporter [Gaiellales bacterium]|nr:MATE family efflux transporter [Gaiellales bacterium]
MDTRMPSDREVLALALPALGALVAEPLYVLGDTAIIGHVGTVPLAGLALAGLLLSEILGFCTFLEYGTTARAARLYGAGQLEAALDAGVQATWLALGTGVILVAGVELAAAPALHAMAGGSTPASAQGLEWIRIAALGAPFVLVTAAAQGWMRGFQDTRTPLYVIGAANLASICLSAGLVFGLDLGIRGSAIANVVAQTASGLLFLVLLVRRGAPLAPSWPRIRRQLASARDLGLRTVAFFVAFTVAASVAARAGDAALAAHQIGAQLWFFTALFLDATAIAAQALIGRLLGAGATDVAHALAHRLLWAGTILGVGFAAILAAGYAVIPALFTSSGPVAHQAHVLWPWLVVMMPVNGWLFALDGVLFGAGDLRFMRNVTVLAALAGYVPIALLTAKEGWGLTGIWIGLSSFVCIRAAVGAARYRGRRWLVGGATLADEAA